LSRGAELAGTGLNHFAFPLRFALFVTLVGIRIRARSGTPLLHESRFQLFGIRSL
jgi:hypothetical protein